MRMIQFVWPLIVATLALGCDGAGLGGKSSSGDAKAHAEDVYSERRPSIHGGPASSEYWGKLYGDAEILAICNGYFFTRRDHADNPDEAEEWTQREAEVFDHLQTFHGHEAAIQMTRAGYRTWQMFMSNAVDADEWARLTNNLDRACGDTLKALQPPRQAWLVETPD